MNPLLPSIPASTSLQIIDNSWKTRLRKRSLSAGKVALHVVIPPQVFAISSSQAHTVKLNGRAHSISPDEKLLNKVKQSSQLKVLGSDLNPMTTGASQESPQKKLLSLKSVDPSNSAILRSSTNNFVSSSDHSLFCLSDGIPVEWLEKVKDKISAQAKYHQPLPSTADINSGMSSVDEEAEAIKPLVVQRSSSSSKAPISEDPIKNLEDYFMKFRTEVAQDSVKANKINQVALEQLKAGMANILEWHRENKNEDLACVKGWALAQQIEKQRRAEIKKLNDPFVARPSREYFQLMDDALTGESIERTKEGS